MKSAKQIAIAFARAGWPVTADTIRNWAKRGVLVKKKSRTRRVRLAVDRIGGRLYFSAVNVMEFLVQLGWKKELALLV